MQPFRPTGASGFSRIAGAVLVTVLLMYAGLRSASSDLGTGALLVALGAVTALFAMRLARARHAAMTPGHDAPANAAYAGYIVWIFAGVPLAILAWLVVMTITGRF